MTPAQTKLFETASLCGGYFSSRDAVDAGIATSNHGFYLSKGEWKKVLRGVYRLNIVSSSKNDDLYRALVWARSGTQKMNFMPAVAGISALCLYGVSHLLPREVSIVAPDGFRKSQVPQGIKLIKSSKFDDFEYLERDGIRLLSPMSAISFLLERESLPSAEIGRIYREARRLGLIQKREISKTNSIYQYTKKEITKWEKDYEASQKFR